jgi:hypothetical protein
MTEFLRHEKHYAQELLLENDETGSSDSNKNSDTDMDTDTDRG